MFFLVYYCASSHIHTVSVMPSSRAEPLRKKSRNLRWASRHQGISILNQKNLVLTLGSPLVWEWTLTSMALLGTGPPTNYTVHISWSSLLHTLSFNDSINQATSQILVPISHEMIHCPSQISISSNLSSLLNGKLPSPLDNPLPYRCRVREGFLEPTLLLQFPPSFYRRETGPGEEVLA